MPADNGGWWLWPWSTCLYYNGSAVLQCEIHKMLTVIMQLNFTNVFIVRLFDMRERYIIAFLKNHRATSIHGIEFMPKI